MAKVEIIGPKNLFFDVVGLIHDQGKLHIEDLSRKIAQGEVPLDQMEIYEAQQRDQEQMDEMLIRVRAILKALHQDDTPMDPDKRAAEYRRLYGLDSNELAVPVETEALGREEGEQTKAPLAPRLQMGTKAPVQAQERFRGTRFQEGKPGGKAQPPSSQPETQGYGEEAAPPATPAPDQSGEGRARHDREPVAAEGMEPQEGARRSDAAVAVAVP